MRINSPSKKEIIQHHQHDQENDIKLSQRPKSNKIKFVKSSQGFQKISKKIISHEQINDESS